MSNFIVLIGFTIGGTVRGVLVGIIVLLISLLFTEVPVPHPGIVIFMGVLSAMVFSLGGLINAVYAKRFDDISFIPTFVLTPLTYLGGVFYSINQLPPTWRNISLFNPILNMVDTFRFGVLGVTDLNVYFGFGFVSILFIIMFFWAWMLLEKGVGIKV